MLRMSEDLRICSKCGAKTLEHTIDCIVPSEMAGLLQKPIPDGPDLRVMLYFCPSCRCVELYAAGGHGTSGHLAGAENCGFFHGAPG
jgi:hypothetical protein